MSRCMTPIRLGTLQKGFRNVPCGRCFACQSNRTNTWAMRILHESRLWPTTLFITLTYSEAHLPSPPTVSKRVSQLFLKRLRRALEPERLRYFLTAEYGGKFGRPHYHVILFSALSKYDGPLLESAWPYGRVDIQQLEGGAAQYVCKYIQEPLYSDKRTYSAHGLTPEFSLMSRRPAIGHNFAARYYSTWLKSGYCIQEGFKKPIPRAYIRKVQDRKLLVDYQVKQWQRINEAGFKSGKTAYERRSQAQKEVPQQLRNIEAKLAINQSKKEYQQCRKKPLKTVLPR